MKSNHYDLVKKILIEDIKVNAQDIPNYNQLGRVPDKHYRDIIITAYEKYGKDMVKFVKSFNGNFVGDIKRRK